MKEQVAEQLEARRAALGLSYYQIEKDLRMTAPTVQAIFQVKTKKGKNYTVNHLFDVMAYMGMGCLTFNYKNIEVSITKK